MSALVPPEDWVEDQDPHYDNPCPACRALVDPDEGGRAVHRAWHLAIVELAEQYVSPPRYGG